MKIKEEVETRDKKFMELREEELARVSGGDSSAQSSGGGYYFPSSIPYTPSTPSTPTESFTVPIKGDENDHIDVEVR